MAVAQKIADNLLIAHHSAPGYGASLSPNPALQPFRTVGESVPFRCDPLDGLQNNFPDPGLIQVSRRGTVGDPLPSVQDFLGFRALPLFCRFPNPASLSTRGDDEVNTIPIRRSRTVFPKPLSDNTKSVEKDTCSNTLT